jgi:hypothetical protein
LNNCDLQPATCDLQSVDLTAQHTTQRGTYFFFAVF